MNYMNKGSTNEIWTSQGGQNTLDSYKRHGYDFSNIPVTHQDLFNRSVYFHVENGDLFVHGGFDPFVGLYKTPKEVLLWDRNLIEFAKRRPVPEFKRVYIGHTTTQGIDGGMKPIKCHNLICMDTGAGWNGRLTIMDIDTEEIGQSRVQRPCI